MNVKIEQTWLKEMKDQWEMPYFADLAAFVRARYGTVRVFPPAKKIFAAFDACPFNKVKVVIIGQDPYHGFGQANGLCFSVSEGVALPPSLINIYKEIASDFNLDESTIPQSGDLSHWASQGVLLLNSTLTVDEGHAGSHQGHGWETFTDAVIAKINERLNNVVFLLWGAYAIKKGALIDRNRHLVLTSPHPSPLSAYRGFFGNRHFSQANAYLKACGKTPVKWI